MRRTRMRLLSALVAMLTLAGGGLAEASHSWNGYKWATTDGVVDLYADVSDVRGDWGTATPTVLGDWSRSEDIVLDTNPAGKQGVVTVQSASYGPTGWLGVAQVKVDSRRRIVAGLVELNEWYWQQGYVAGLARRQHVYCQEMGHLLGLGHQRGSSCMNDGVGTLGDWVNPDRHDYEQLAAIYRDPDGYNSGTLSGSSRTGSGARAAQNWVVVHAFPAPGVEAHGWMAELGQALTTLPAVSTPRR